LLKTTAPVHVPVVQQNAASATPVVGSNVVMQSRRLYVGNIPFGVSEVSPFLLGIITYLPCISI